MKPCVGNRKRIALLAVGALEARETIELRAHLRECDACQQYQEEISTVTARLNEVTKPADIEASEAFHRRLTNTIKSEDPASAGEGLAAWLQDRVLNWRVALYGFTALLMGVALLLHSQHQAILPNPGTIANTPATSPATESNLEPSIRNYQIAASQSFEQLDKLLTKQARQNPTSSPIYTASTLNLANGPE